MSSIVVTRALNVKSESYIYASPCPPNGISDEETHRQAIEILNWLGSTVVGNVYKKVIELAQEKNVK